MAEAGILTSPVSADRTGAPARVSRAEPATPLERVALGALVALIYVVARPPLYQRDGWVYHLLGRDFLGGTNPHHLLWNAVEWLIGRAGALVGVASVLPFQLAGMACGVASAVLLHGLLLRLGARRALAFAAALFVACTPWFWFMTFQNQPYALMFLLMVVFLRGFASPDGDLPRGRRFATAAAAAVGMVMLQQAAVFIVVGAAVCFLALGGVRRAVAWAAATGGPTALLYVFFGALAGVRGPADFERWTTGYLRSQHSLQVRFPDFLVKGAMGIFGTFVNQEPLRDRIVDAWSAPAIMWFYGAIVAAMLVGVAALVLRWRRAASPSPAAARSLVWISVASIASWAVFCFLWEPTNYYWFILLAPFFVVAAALRSSASAARLITAGLVLATAWNLYGNHAWVDAAGSRRAPEPQLAVIAGRLRPNDLLWVVDLGWSEDVDYDLLATTAAFEHRATIASIADVVGRSRDSSTWQRTIEDSSRSVMRRGGRVFVSDRIYDEDTFARTWERSPFADYDVERPFPVDWAALGRQLPAFVERTYEIAPSGFLVGSDTIWRLEPLRP